MHILSCASSSAGNPHAGAPVDGGDTIVWSRREPAIPARPATIIRHDAAPALPRYQDPCSAADAGGLATEVSLVLVWRIDHADIVPAGDQRERHVRVGEQADLVD